MDLFLYLVLGSLRLSTVSCQSISGDCSQWLMIFNVSNCNETNGYLKISHDYGDNDATTTTTLNGFENTISFRIFGLWRIRPCTSVEEEDCGPASPQNSLGGCFNYTKQSWISHLTCTQYGDALQKAKSFNYYLGTDLDPQRNRIVQDTPTLSVTPGSFYFTGNNSWTVYTERNYGGKATCLTPDEEVRSNGYGFTVRTQLSQVVKSVREGCHESGSTTTEGCGDKCSSSSERSGRFTSLLVFASILFISYLKE